MQAITKLEFDILDTLAEGDLPVTEEELAAICKHSVETTRRAYRGLTQEGAIDENGKITGIGFDLLEPYRAQRAVLLAAGFGTRMVPLTFNTPKPLIRVHGKRIIDGIIDALLDAGVNEIYIVRGYLAEQFDQLLYKYPMLKFIENPAYNDTNNISSAMCARYLFQGAYIFEADMLIRNTKLIKKYQYQSNYLGFYRDRSDDWCFTVDSDGIIQEQKVGGLNCYQEIGISYWTPADGARLAEDLKAAYEMPGGKEIFWDQSAFRIFKGHYKVAVRECDPEDIVELDSFKDLKAIDPTYNV